MPNDRTVILDASSGLTLGWSFSDDLSTATLTTTLQQNVWCDTLDRGCRRCV